MSRFTTGVTVVTTHAEGQDWGMTCNSFNTVSLDPALVLWSIRRASFSHAAFLASGRYLVNVLAAHQKDLALRFAMGSQTERFEGLTPLREQGLPRVPEALAWFVCRTVQVVEVPPGPPVQAPLVAEVYAPDTPTRHALAQAVRQRFDATARDEVAVFAALREWKNQFK